MSTHGYDIDVSWQDHIGDFKYSIGLNFSDYLSKIDYLNNSDIISGGKVKEQGSCLMSFMAMFAMVSIRHKMRCKTLQERVAL